MIKISNLKKKYNNKIVLDIEKLEIKKSLITAIIGKSGSGKSTLVNIISGIIEKSEGNILIDGKEIEKYSKKELSKKVAIVFQEYSTSLNPKMSILEILSEPFIINKKNIDMNKINEVLKITNLNNLDINQNIMKLSGGEKQRLVISRTLILNPDLIIFDEAISSLDLHIAMQIIKIINKLNKEFGKTIIFITHNLEFLKFLTENILKIDEGKIIKEG